MDYNVFSVTTGWIGFLGGILSGAYMGLFFYKENFAGGYGAFPRRMIRLGHISFFGLGLINILFGLSITVIPLDDFELWVGSYALLISLCTMPICCFLTAWKSYFRHLFPIPVISALIGVGAMIKGSILL